MRASSSTTESAYLLLDSDEKGLARVLRRLLEEFDRRLLHVAVEVGDADDAVRIVDALQRHVLIRLVDVLTDDLEVFLRLLAGLARNRPDGDLLEHRPQFGIHVGEPGRIAVGVCVQVVQADVLHLVVALSVGQRVVGLAQVPLAGEVGLVAALLEHGGQRPLRRGQPSALALEGHGRHAAAIWDATGLHGRPARRAARLRVEREERHPFVGHTVDVGRRHAAPRTAAVRAQVTVPGVVRDDEEDVRLARLGGDHIGCAQPAGRSKKRQGQDARTLREVSHLSFPPGVWQVVSAATIAISGEPTRQPQRINATQRRPMFLFVVLPMLRT